MRCGGCCRWEGSVLLTDADIHSMALHLQLSEDAFIQTYTTLARNRAQLTLLEQPDGACIFLDDTACRIYPVRPQQCRDFPHVWHVQNRCPGLSDTPTE